MLCTTRSRITVSLLQSASNAGYYFHHLTMPCKGARRHSKGWHSRGTADTTITRHSAAVPPWPCYTLPPQHAKAHWDAGWLEERRSWWLLDEWRSMGQGLGAESWQALPCSPSLVSRRALPSQTGRAVPAIWHCQATKAHGKHHLALLAACGSVHGQCSSRLALDSPVHLCLWSRGGAKLGLTTL